MLFALSININKLLPMKQQLTYSINVTPIPGAGETKARIIDTKGDHKFENPTEFIASNLLESYVINRENFNYSYLAHQFKYVETTSTRLVYRRFYNYMSVNNPESPVMRYQQYGKRNITITNIEFISENEAIVYFNSIAKDSSNAIFENLNWSANIVFEMAQVRRHLSPDGNFKFIVTDYNLKLLGEAK
jgi:type IV secretion system protein VirB8